VGDQRQPEHGTTETLIDVDPQLVTLHAFEDAGVSLRRLQHWTSRGWIRASNPHPGSGRILRWPVDELRVARLMVLLVDVGRLQPAGAAMAVRELGRLAPGIRVTVDREDLFL
jgi:hypothetical protein